jgi:hypothetical protein
MTLYSNSVVDVNEDWLLKQGFLKVHKNVAPVQ